MRKVVCVLLMVASMAAEAFDASSVYNRLLRYNAVTPVQLFVRSGVTIWCSLACYTGSSIIVSTEALSYVLNEDELAGMIGHEMAHAKYKDEMQADILGLDYAMKAGYNYCKAARWLKGLIADKVHPSGAYRYANTGCH